MREPAGMKQAHREALRSAHLLLAKQLVPGELCQHLLAQRILTEEMLELIEAKNGPFSRNVELLRLLPKRGPCAFDAFCQALRDTEQGHLAALLHEQLPQGPDVPSQTPRLLEVAPEERAKEGESPPWKLRRLETAESSLDDGDGPLSCCVFPCSEEFYRCHREKSYRMESRPRGLAIIVSNVRFGGVHELVDRQGGEVDHRALEKLLTSLGFDVRSLHDQTAQVMRSELLHFAQLPDHQSSHSCVVALLSHGVEGAVYGTDGELLQLQDVFRLFDNDSCPQLQNKPKIFFIQACRGEETDCGVDIQDGKDRSLSPECEQSDSGLEEPPRMKLPTRSDIICGYACLKGMAALRNTRRGTWYVQALTQVLSTHAKDTHLADMLVKLYGHYTEGEPETPRKEAPTHLQDGHSWQEADCRSPTQAAGEAKRIEGSGWAARRCFYQRLVSSLGEDWIFLVLLGLVMALVSWAMDYVSAKGLHLYKWLYILAKSSLWLQYLVWVGFPLVLIIFSTLLCMLVSPQAAGSGIPELKTIIRGAVLHEYLSFRTFIAKTLGLTAVLSTGLPVGKEGPFVHIASICAALISKFLSFLSGTLEHAAKTIDRLIPAAAIGVACCFGSPLGGVLFSIEVTCTYFAVRNYWRGFLGGTFSAFIFRVLSVWIKDAVTITALFKTNFRGDYPFDLQELPAFALVGIVCGFLGAGFVYLNRLFVIFMKKRNILTRFLMKQKLIYPTVLTFILATISFPPGAGQFMGAELMPRETINSLFDNYTWSKVTDPKVLGPSATWFHSQISIFLVLLIYIVMNFWMAAAACTMPIPCGAFIPVLNMGAAFGRLIGETMVVLFPDGLMNQGKMYHILPGGYAVIGAAAMTGAMTHTVSTAVICFELTGEIYHVLPMMVAVILANMVAQGLQPSLYDSIIQIKKLPYLPEFGWGQLSKNNISAGDIMVRNVWFVASTSCYGDLVRVLKHSRLNTFPFVDTPESMILLGSVERSELRALLLRQATGPHGGTTGHHRPRAEKHSPFVYRHQEDSGLQQREGPDVEKIISTDKAMPSTTTYNAKDPKPEGSGKTSLRNLFSSLRRNMPEADPLQEPSSLGESLKLEEIIGWDRRDVTVSFETCRIDPSPYQLVEKTSLQKTHTLFSLLGLDRAYVTSLGRLVGVVALREIQAAIEGTSQKGVRFRPPLATFRDNQEARKSGRLLTEQRPSPKSRNGSPLSRSTAIPDGATQTTV